MMQEAIITDWKPEYASMYGNENLLLNHRLHKSELFTLEGLSDLIDQYHDGHYNLNTMGFDPENPVWREGTFDGFTGKQVIEAIKNGRMWLNLRGVDKFDSRYGGVLDDMFEEIEDRVPGLSTFNRRSGILISSPNVQVFYHADIPGQSLMQIHGEKRVFVYPNKQPYLPQLELEGIMLGETEEEIPYQRSFDEAATVYDLKPGEMLHWPLNCPHRVENKDCLNISLTTEYWTNDIRKSFAVHYANGILRRKLGINNLSTSIHSPTVYPKAALALAWRKLKLNESSKFVPKIDFSIDPNSQTGITDIPAYYAR